MKRTGQYASEESFTITSGSAVVFSSPTLADVEDRTFELCIPNTANGLFLLTMNDGMSDSWSDGAWILIEGVNGNTVLKTMMTELVSETARFALYSPINKDDTWLFRNTFEPNWYMYDLSDASWTNCTLGSSQIQAVWTQYFSKTFVGRSDMASIDVQFLYKQGIVAYINGVEIFRDNMLAGDVSEATAASSTYSKLTYHGVLRPSSVASSPQSVLAVELHFIPSEQTMPRLVDFNAFLAFGAGIEETNNCFISYAPATISGEMAHADHIVDYTRNTGVSTTASGLPRSILFSFDEGVVPMANAIRIWPYNSPNAAPTSFSLSGGQSVSSLVWNSIMNLLDRRYTSLQWSQFDVLADPIYYKAFKMTITDTVDIDLYFYEIQFLICNKNTYTIAYEKDSYSFFARYSTLNLGVNAFGITSCVITPPLPEGLHFDTTNCAITGFALQSSPETTYLVTAHSGAKIASGTVTLTFDECEGSLLRIVRTYKLTPGNESFRIRNTVTDELLLEIPTGHTDVPNKDHSHFLCMTADRFDVTVDGLSRYWSSGSYIKVYAVLADGEEDLMLKARFDQFQNNEGTYYLRRQSITIMEQWYYKMGELPANWYNDNTLGWSQGNRNSFSSSTNTIQLYKREFVVDNLNSVSGVIVGIRYLNGCVVYLNGNEVFRNHVPSGTITSSTLATESYSTLSYHTFTLPGRFINDNGTSPIPLLKEGVNIIAISLLARTYQEASHFDATVRLMAKEPESHIWDFIWDSTEISNPAENAFDGYYSTNIYHTALESETPCRPNSLTITLDNDRREWVNMVQIQNYYNGMGEEVKSFNLYGRNPGDADWTLLKCVKGLTYSMPGQKRRYLFTNRVSYNQFKFENFGTEDPDSCTWKIQSLNLYAVSVMNDPTPLVYAPSLTIFKGVEMSEFIPQGDGYFDYSIQPELPEGLQIDASNGWISGTHNGLLDMTTYVVRAHKVTGGVATTSFKMNCEVCVGERGLVTVRIRADAYANENSWKLYEGRGLSGTLLRSTNWFPVSNSYYYLDFCLSRGIYTFQGIDAFGDGWSAGSGYTLIVDTGEMELDIEELNRGQGSPVFISTVFSTYFPFQVGYTTWKVSQSGEVAAWNSVGFDDHGWETKKAAEIGNPNSVTTYIRKSFSLTGIDDYQVLNARVKYAGGVAVYFNGNKVARFNLAEDFGENTESMTIHDPTVFSKFHIILGTAGVQEGTNVIAFEIHRPVGTSSTDPFVFDATGVFGVETCSTVIDSFSDISSTSPLSGAIEDLMDLNPFTIVTMPALKGTFIEWTVENLEGSKWNSFNILGISTVSTWMLEIIGFTTPEDPDSRLELMNGNGNIQQRTKPQIPVPVAVAGFRKFRYEVIEVSMESAIEAIFAAYCRASGSVCPGTDNYPAVEEGQISPAACPDGFNGYAYRECTNGVLGEVRMEHCKYKVPSMIHYQSTRFDFVRDVVSSTEKPTYRNIITRWFLDDGVNLPLGLLLDEQTGEIYGIPTEEMSLHSYIVRVENPSSAAFVEIQISVRKGRCNAEEEFPTIDVGEVAEHRCAEKGYAVGVQRRACILGEKDGEWQKATGVCISYFTLILMSAIVVVIVMDVTLLFLRMEKRIKTIGGMKRLTVVKNTIPKTGSSGSMKV